MVLTVPGKGIRAKLTVKLLDPVPRAFKERATARQPDRMSLLLGLMESMLQGEEQRGSSYGEDNRPGAEPPSPAIARKSIELLANGRTSKGCNDVWGRSESVSKSSVLQLGHVGREDINTVFHSTEAHHVERLAYHC